ncbi:uncharacterized protein VNE69_08187 [Vairimorpha necatrix]|uniref:Uncharacterized protein n=1 Tax=Vairimorpha necatrix TaxID=6039 RepID=A0AAX4JEM0_9MICR
MFEKLSEDKRKLIQEKINSYGLENENTDEEILEKIFNTLEYKKYLESENSVDDTDNYVKKSNILQNYNKRRNQNRENK